MANYVKTLSCAQVADIGEAKRQYQQEFGCTVRREHGACATFDCPDGALYICETPEDEVLTRTPHDELDEASDAYW